MVSRRRFWGAASWLLALTSSAASVPLVRRVTPSYPSPPSQDTHIRELRCDASPWGGGGIFLFDGQPIAKWSMTWTVQLAQILQLEIGS
eukprot:1911770-Amphidinium_carterae.1